MKRYARKKDLPLPKVKNYEVTNQKMGLRIIITVVCVIVACISIALGVKNCITIEAGIYTIEADATNINCADEFEFKYNVGQGSASATNEKNALVSLYTAMVENLGVAYSAYIDSADFNNLYYINHHPNELITVSSYLYDALEELDNNRIIYMAPIYDYYQNTFGTGDDLDVSFYDPDKNEDTKEYFDELLTYINDANAVSLLLYGNNQVYLKVSDEYLEYAEKNDITVFTSFMYLENAVIIDEMASIFIANNYTNGIITSVDGYTVNLGDYSEGNAYTLYDYQNKKVISVANVSYSGLQYIVNYRSFKAMDGAENYYHIYDDNTIATPFIAAGSYSDKLASSCIYTASSKNNCLSLALAVIGTFHKTQVGTADITLFKLSGYDVIYIQDTVIYYTNKNYDITIDQTNGYTKEIIR